MGKSYKRYYNKIIDTMKILITGGLGFIGSHIAEFYAKEKNNIIIIDNFSRDGCKLHKKDLEKYKNIKFYIDDVRNFRNIQMQIKSFIPDVIFHTAGQTAVTTSYINPYEDFQINTVGTVNLLEAVRRSNCDPAIVFCSTNKVFGNVPNKNPTNETTRTDISPHTPYGASKNSADLYMREYAHDYDLKTGIFRMSCIYGSKQFRIEDQGWISHFIISAVRNKKINIFGNGNQVRDVLYVSDLIKAYDSFIKKANKLKGEVFNVGGGKLNILSLNELIAILKRLLVKKIKIEYKEWRLNDQKIYISDISKANKILHWKPEISPIEGVKKVVDWAKTVYM